MEGGRWERKRHWAKETSANRKERAKKRGRREKKGCQMVVCVSRRDSEWKKKIKVGWWRPWRAKTRGEWRKRDAGLAADTRSQTGQRSENPKSNLKKNLQPRRGSEEGRGEPRRKNDGPAVVVSCLFVSRRRGRSFGGGGVQGDGVLIVNGGEA
jgi:hypothetical protein